MATYSKKKEEEQERYASPYKSQAEYDHDSQIIAGLRQNQAVQNAIRTRQEAAAREQAHIQRYNTDEDYRMAYNKQQAEAELESKKKRLERFEDSSNDVGFWDAILPGGATPTEYKESRQKKKQYEKEAEEAAAQVAAYEQFLKEKEIQGKTSAEIDAYLAEGDRQIAQLQEEKGSFWEAMKPGGVKPSEYNANRKAKEAEIKKLESQQGAYRAVRDEKKSREMTDKLPEDVIKLLDEYNSIGDISQANQMAAVIAPESSMMYNSANNAQAERKKKIAEELVKKGYTNYAELAEYRQYVRDVESSRAAEESISAFAKEHPVASSAMSVVLSPAASVAGAVGTAENIFGEKKSDLGANPYDSWYFLDEYRNVTRQAVPETFEDGMLSAKTKGMLYNTAMSGADSAFAGLTMGTLGAASLGMSALNDSYVNALKKGATEEQAIATGVFAGAAEGIFEAVSLGYFFKGVEPTDVLGIAKNVLVQAGVNAQEEAATEAANILTDYLINGGLSDYYQNYENALASGMSEEEAKKYAKEVAVKQVGEAALSGALMGTGFGVIGSATGNINYNSALKEAGKQAVNEGNVETVLAGASDIEGNETVSNLISEVEGIQNAAGEKTKLKGKEYRTIGKLMEQLDKVTGADRSKLIETAVKKRLTELGEVDDIDVKTSAISKLIENGGRAKGDAVKLSNSEKKAVRKGIYTRRVLNEVNDAAGVYSSAWADALSEDIANLFERRYEPDVEKFRTEREVKAEEKAKALVKETLITEGQNEEEFNAGFDLYYEQGKLGGYEFNEIKDNPNVSESFTDYQKAQAFEQGQHQALKDIGNARYKGDTVAVFINGYSGKDTVKRYASAFNIFYSEGMHSKMSFEEVFKREALDKVIDEGTARKAFEAGRKQSTSAQRSDEKQIKRAPKKDGSYVSKTIEEGEIDTFLEAFSKKLGLDTVRVQKIINGEDEANAQIDLESGKMVSSASSRNEYQSTIHESVHLAYAYGDSKKMAEIESSMKDYFIHLHGAASFENVIRQYAEAYTDLDRAGVMEEFTADALAGVFSSEDGVNEFVDWLQKDSGYSQAEKKTILQKLSEWLLEIVDKIRELVAEGHLNSVTEAYAKAQAEQFADVREKFLQVLDEIEGVEGSEGDGGVRYSLNNYSEHQIENWNNSKRIVVYKNDEQLKQFINDSLKDNKMDKKMYFGTIPSDLADKIKFETGVNVEKYNLSLGSYEIRKILKSHGNEEKEAARGQRAITTDDFMHIVDIVLNPTKITRSETDYMGKPVITFKGIYNGTMNVTAVVSDKRLDVFVQTIFVNIKKENLSTPIDEQASINTPEANNGTVFETNITHRNNNVKSSYKMNDIQLTELTEEKREVDNEIFSLRRQFDDLKKTDDYERLETAVVESHGNDEAFNAAIDEYNEWIKSSGMGEINRKLTEAKEKSKELMKKINKLEESLHSDFMKSIESFSEEEVSKYVSKAVRKFKTTSRFDLAGYLTTTGSLLDFSDGQGYRVRDHREIKEVLDMPEYARYSDSMIAFMNMGNIRLQSYGVDVSKMPNSKQIAVLRRFFNSLNGEVVVDFSLPDGNSAGSIEYPENTKADRILNDIKKYFDTGVVPELSDVQRFRYSRKFSLDWIDFAEEQERERSAVSELTELKKINDELRAKIQHPGVKHIVSQLGVQKVARHLKGEYMSKINIHKLAGELGDFYTLIANGDGISWDSLQIHIERIADMILDESKYKKPDISDYAKDVLRELRSSKISLSEEQKAAISEKYGSYNNYRKKMMGSLVLSNDGTSLDERWAELSGMYPNLFSEDTVDLDQPEAMLELIASLRETYEDMNGMDLESAKDMLMTEIYEQYFEVPETKYISEEYKLKYAKAKAEFSEKIREAKADFKKQRDEAYRKAKAEYGEILKGIREEEAEAILQARARYNLRAEKMADTRVREKKRANIIRQVKRLDRLLRTPGKGAPSAGTNKYEQKYVHLTNIPESLKRTVIDFCSVFIEHDAGVFSGYKKNDSVSVREKKIEALQKQYKLLKQTDVYLKESVVEGMAEKLDKVAEIMAERRLSQLTASELDTVIEITDHLITVINNQVEMWVDGKKHKVEGLGSTAVDQLTAKGQYKHLALPGHDFVKGWGVNNMKPVYFFERVGGVLEKLFLEMQNKGQRDYARNINAAAAFMDETSKKFAYEKWTDEDPLVLETTQGHTLKLTKAQAMHIWATAKREVIAGKDSRHIMQGGIVFEDEIDADIVSDSFKDKVGNVTDKKKLTDKVWKYKKSDGSAHRISLDDLDKISEYLTDEQKKFVDTMVGYLSNDMAALGNEVSMELYGIKRFNEKYYIPFNSAKNFIYRSMGEQGEAMLRSESFTKETTWGANNPLVVGDFLDVVAGHIERMAMYNSMVLPLENFSKIWNFKIFALEGSGNPSTVSVRSAMETAFGKSYVSYVDTLLKDINGGINADSREKSMGRLLSNFKKTAVLGSASVVIQQPSAIVRAFAEIDPSYFVATTFAGRKKAWEKALKYSSTALLKDIGGFDTVSGRGTADWLTKKEYKGKDKVIAFFKDSQYRDDIIAWGPGFADKVTWAHIWAACEREVAHDNKGLQGEELYKKTGERFDEVINKTQVYDSVLTRSAHMRSKSNAMQAVTAFMSEPTTQANMIASAIFNAKKGDKKKAARIYSSVILSQLFNAALVSIIYAARDDDDEKTPLEEYIAELTSNFLGSLNPITMIPLFKDVWSMLEGYDIERSDMSVYSDLIDSYKAWQSDSKTYAEKIRGTIGSIGNAFGLPLKNILRDAAATVNVAKSVGDISDTTGKGIWYAIEESSFPVIETLTSWKPTTKDEKLYAAFSEGDRKMYNRIASQYTSGGKIKSDLKKQIGERFVEGDIDEQTAISQFRKLGLTENEAYYEVRSLKEPLPEEDSEDTNADFFDFDSMQSVQGNADAESGEAKGDYDWLENALATGDRSDIQKEINDLKNRGVPEDDINSKIKSWIKANDSTVAAEAERYKQGNLNSFESTVKSISSKYGVDESSVAGAIRSAAGDGSKAIEGTIYAYGDLHAVMSVNNSAQSKKIAGEIVNAKTQQYIAEGETNRKAKEKAENAVRTSLRSYWKEEYLKSDTTRKGYIRLQLKETGLWTSSEVLKMTREWDKEK